MKQIVFTRHAETPENKTGVLQGAAHFGFTKDGLTNLKKLKKELDQYDFQVALVSSLPRCQETADYILGHRRSIIRAEPLANEKSSGEFAGKPSTDKLWGALRGTFETKKPPGGESLREVRNRAKKFVQLLATLPEQKILVVSHGGFLKVLFGMLLGKDLRESIFDLRVDHCSLTFLEVDKVGKTAFRKLNETKHLSA